MLLGKMKKLYDIYADGVRIRSKIAENIEIREVKDHAIPILIECYSILESILKDNDQNSSEIMVRKDFMGKDPICHRLSIMYESDDYDDWVTKQCVSWVRAGNINIEHESGRPKTYKKEILLADPDCFNKYRKIMSRIIKEIYKSK